MITEARVRLDLPADRDSLRATVAAIRPRLLVLDPFVRLHAVDENVSGAVAPLLAFLRDLQREYGVAVVVVHHSRKGATNMRGGQALRGSSEFHAWGDSNIYLRRAKDDLLSMAIEHRAAASQDGIALRLKTDGGALALSWVDPATVTEEPAAGDVEEAIRRALEEGPANITMLKKKVGKRHGAVKAALESMIEAGEVKDTDDGYALAG